MMIFSLTQKLPLYIKIKRKKNRRFYSPFLIEHQYYMSETFDVTPAGASEAVTLCPSIPQLPGDTPDKPRPVGYRS